MELRGEVSAQGDAVWRPCGNRKELERWWGGGGGRQSHEVKVVEFESGNTKKSQQNGWGMSKRIRSGEGRPSVLSVGVPSPPLPWISFHQKLFGGSGPDQKVPVRPG